MFRFRTLALLVALGQPLVLQAITISNKLDKEITIYCCEVCYIDQREFHPHDILYKLPPGGILNWNGSTGLQVSFILDGVRRVYPIANDMSVVVEKINGKITVSHQYVKAPDSEYL